MAPTPRLPALGLSTPLFAGSRSPLGWLLILRSMLSALLLLLAALSLRSDHSACSSSSFSTSLMSLFALRSRDSCRGTWEGCGEQRGGHQPSSRDLGCWALGLGMLPWCWLRPWHSTRGVGEEGGDSQGVFCPHAVAGGRESSLGQLQLPCCALVPFLPSMVFLTCCRLLLWGCHGQGEVADAPTEACGSHRRSPLALVAFRSRGLQVAEGGGPGQPPAPSPARARWQQECDTYTWCLTKDAGLCKHILWALL